MAKVKEFNPQAGWLSRDVQRAKKRLTQWHTSWAYVGGMLCAVGITPAWPQPIVTPSGSPFYAVSGTIALPFEHSHPWRLKAPGLLEMEGTAFAIAYNEKTFEYELRQFGVITLAAKELSFIKRMGWDRAAALQEMALPLK